MPEIVHLGDCSTTCNRCAQKCAENQHYQCTGTKHERRWGDWLMYVNQKENTSG